MKINFEAELRKIQSRQVIVIPLESSKKLPSRGMVMACLSLKGRSFIAPLEPDGRGSHWFEVSEKFSEDTQLKVGDSLEIVVELVKDWPEPEVPKDILDEIDRAHLRPMWDSITTKARWDWLRWIRSTDNIQTRRKRIEVEIGRAHV